MSTEVNTYVLYGAILDYDEVNRENDDDYDDGYERCEPFFVDDSFDPEKVGILYDGMSGKYVAIGHIIARTEDYQHFHSPISLSEHETRLAEWATDTLEVIRVLGLDPANRKFGWHVISHYR